MKIKKIPLFLVGCCMIGLFPSTLHANSIQPNQTFTVNGSCGNNEGAIRTIANNATITNDGSGGWCDRGKSFSITARANAAGTASIQVVAVDVTDAVTVKPIPAGTVLASGSVQVVVPTPQPPKPTPKPPKPSNPQPSKPNKPQTPSTQPKPNTPQNSGNQQKPSTPQNQNEQVLKEEDKSETQNDARLRSLHITPGKLEPEFSSDQYTYVLQLNKDETSIEIQAQAINEKSVIKGIGKKEIKKDAENVFEIQVELEGNTTKTYSVEVINSAQISVEYNNKQLHYISKNDIKVPENFEETTIELGGQNVKAYKNSLNNIVIVTMRNDENQIDFYMYDENAKKITSIYKPFALLGQNLVIIDVPKELQDRKEMTYKEIQIEEFTLMGWEFNDASLSNYRLIYVLDENGVANYYLYEMNGHTLQLYSKQAPISENQWLKEKQDQENKLSQMQMFLIISIGVNVILLVIIIYLIFIKRNRKNAPAQSRFIKDETISMPQTNPISNENPMESMNIPKQKDNNSITMNFSRSNIGVPRRKK